MCRIGFALPRLRRRTAFVAFQAIALAVPAGAGAASLEDVSWLGPLRPTFDSVAAARSVSFSAMVTSHLSLPPLGPFPSIEVRTILIGLHLLGLCFGLGGATMLYFWIFRWIRWGYLPAEIIRTFAYLSKVVTTGLALLWVSGLGFLLIYWCTDPGKLANQKIWAKLIIVAVLTINGLVLHPIIMPLIKNGAGAPLLYKEANRRRLLFVLSGATSGTSWYMAFALGILRELNGKVSWVTLVSVWAVSIGFAIAGMSGLIVFLWPHRTESDPSSKFMTSPEELLSLEPAHIQVSR